MVLKRGLKLMYSNKADSVMMFRQKYRNAGESKVRERTLTWLAANSFLYFSHLLLMPFRGLEPSPASCSATLSALSSSKASWGWKKRNHSAYCLRVAGKSNV